MSGFSPLTIEDLASSASNPRTDYKPITPYDVLFPRLERMIGTVGDLIVVLDFSERLSPYRWDMHQLVVAMKKRWPDRKMSFRYVDNPLGGWMEYGAQHAQSQAWDMGEHVTPMLIVSDLGQLGHRTMPGVWQKFISYLQPDLFGQRKGSLVTVLTMSGYGFESEYVLKDRVIPWSENGNIPYRANNIRFGFEDLLAMGSVAMRIDPPLLRDLRLALPYRGKDDPGLEGLFWASSCVIKGGFVAWVENPAFHPDQFRRLPISTQQEVFRLMMSHHAHLRRSVTVMETLLFAVNASLEALSDSLIAEQVAAAEQWLHRLFVTIEGNGDIPQMCREIAGGMRSNANAALKAKYPMLAGT